MKNIFLLSLIFFTRALFASDDCVSYGVNFRALLLHSSSSNLYYGAEATPLPLPSPNWKSLEIQTDLHFGFDVGIKALFNKTNTSLQVNWERMHSSDSSSKTVSNEDMVGPYFNIGPNAHPYKIARGHVTHEFDDIALHLGKQLDFCTDFKANYYGGVAFTRIKQTITSNFSNSDGTITRHIEAPSLFRGVGPKFGVDFSYSLCGDFSFIGDTSMAFLLGTIENKTTFLSNTPLLVGLNITPPNRQQTDVPDRVQLVPAFCGKLGFSYAACFNSCTISVDLGYQVQAYLNAIQSVDMSSEVEVPTTASEVGVFALGFRRTVSDFFLAGPYIMLDVTF